MMSAITQKMCKFNNLPAMYLLTEIISFIFAELRLDARDGAMGTVIDNSCPMVVNFGCDCACLSSLWFSSKRLA